MLSNAYGDGLLSENTLVHRLDQLFGHGLVDPRPLVGDLTIRAPNSAWRSVIARSVDTWQQLRYGRDDNDTPPDPPFLLALDWSGGQEELLIGRHPACDFVLDGAAVSRRHAQLRFRDGSWVLKDLDSTNGTTVNGVPVGRCRLCPGDLVEIGGARLLVD